MRRVDVLHVAYGGLGGHVAVVNTLTKQFAPLGLSAGVVAVGPAARSPEALSAWSGVDFVETIEVRRRADIASMVDAFRVARRLDARMIVAHTLRHATPVAIGQFIGNRRLNLVTRENHGLPARSRRVDVLSASAVLWGKATIFLTPENLAGYPLRKWPLPGLRRKVVIPNGVDTALYRPRPRPALHDIGQVTVGMAARFVPGKDFDSVIRGIAFLRNEYPLAPPLLALAGDGPTRRAAELLVEELGISDLVTFRGQIPERGMPAFLDGLDVYVQMTDGEAFSMSLIQACASGLPVVTTDVPGVRDVFIDRDNALVIAPRSPDALAGAIRELLGDDGSLATGISERGLRMATQQFSAARMADSYLELFAAIDQRGPWSAARGHLDAWH